MLSAKNKIYDGFELKKKWDQIAIKRTDRLVILFYTDPSAKARWYPPNSRGTEHVFSDIRVLYIEIYVLSFSCLAMGINLVQDKEPRD